MPAVSPPVSVPVSVAWSEIPLARRADKATKTAVLINQELATDYGVPIKSLGWRGASAEDIDRFYLGLHRLPPDIAKYAIMAARQNGWYVEPFRPQAMWTLFFVILAAGWVLTGMVGFVVPLPFDAPGDRIPFGLMIVGVGCMFGAIIATLRGY